MTRHLWIPLISGLVSLNGCASYDGHYAPDCLSYSGNTIDLASGRFDWDKFTDQVRVDDDGRVIDAFPDYPKQGSYRVDGDRLLMTSDAGEVLPVLYVVHSADRTYLYTQDQYAAWQKYGSPARCPLVLGGFRERE